MFERSFNMYEEVYQEIMDSFYSFGTINLNIKFKNYPFRRYN